MKKSELRQIIKEEIHNLLKEDVDQLNLLFNFLKRSLKLHGPFELRINPDNTNIIELFSNSKNVDVKGAYTLIVEKTPKNKFKVTAGSEYEGVPVATESFDINDIKVDWSNILKFIQKQFNFEQGYRKFPGKTEDKK